MHRLHLLDSPDSDQMSGDHDASIRQMYSADVCDESIACDFRAFYLNSSSDEERELLTRMYLKPGVSDALKAHWMDRNRCCATFTDLNTQFGMLSHARGLFYIALVVVGLVMNVILMVDVFRIKQEIGYYGVDQFFPLTIVMLFLYQHCAVINIMNEVFVETLIVHWNFTFWWEWSEQVCILFQYISGKWLKND